MTNTTPHPTDALPLTEQNKKLWLWKNHVDGRPEYWAFDNPFPVHMESDDPQTFGEPCGYALFKPSRVGRTDVSEAEVLRRISLSTPLKRAKSITDELMDLVDRLSSEASDVEPRAWNHLRTYIPSAQNIDALPMPDLSGMSDVWFHIFGYARQCAPGGNTHGLAEKINGEIQKLIRAARREGFELAMSTRADLLAEAHAQIRHLIDDLTTAVDDDGLTRYVPPAANSLVYSNMIGALIPLATRMAEALASQPAQEQPISKAQEGREPVGIPKSPYTDYLSDWWRQGFNGEQLGGGSESVVKAWQRGRSDRAAYEAKKVATSPPPKSDEARDAERYRLLRNGSGWPAVFASSDAPEPLRGEELDAALATQQKGGAV